MDHDKEAVLNFIKENLSYRSDTGDFLWLSNRASGKIKSGSIAGSLNKGYRQIRIDGKWYKCHRLVWLVETGDWPTGQIDHLNLDRTDNRYPNLRDVSNYINCTNRSRSSSSGVVGVSYDRKNKKWLAQTYIEGKARNLGRFNTIEEAEAVYSAVNKERLIDDSTRS